MFLSSMLVGYATSKFTDKKASTTPWHARLFAKKPQRPQATASDDASWSLGAEAWVTVPPQREC